MGKLSAISFQLSVFSGRFTENCQLKTKNYQRGSSLAWTALLLAGVLLPLLTLVLDGTRLFYVRGRLQTALDAACEDAAWSGADQRAFRESGVTRFIPEMGPVLAQAQATFAQTLGERGRVNFSAAATLQPVAANATVRCSAAASVPLALLAGRSVTIPAQTVSAIRFTR